MAGREIIMRATGPLIVLLVVLSWTLPAHADAQTPIPTVDEALGMGGCLLIGTSSTLVVS